MTYQGEIAMTIEEIKIRQLTNQHLIVPTDKMTVVRDLCGLQAQFMTNAMHALKIRCNDYSEDTATIRLVKNWTLRGTVHVFAESDLPLFVCTKDSELYRKNEWNGYTFWNQRDKWALSPERQAFFSSIIISAVAKDPVERDGLKEICRQNGMTEAEESSMFDPWGGGIRELCERGFMNYIVQEKKAFLASPEFTPLPEGEAKLEIARRYFINYGPATVHDAMYFLGAKQAEVKKWISMLPVESFEYKDKTYYSIPNGKSYDREIPPCLFLAGFDPLMLGYQKKENLYLPDEHLRGIFNLAGIVMPALLLHGRVVGKWKNKSGHLTVTLFEAISNQELRTVTDTAAQLWHDLKKIDFN